MIWDVKLQIYCLAKSAVLAKAHPTVVTVGRRLIRAEHRRAPRISAGAPDGRNYDIFALEMLVPLKFHWYLNCFARNRTELFPLVFD